MRRRDLTILQFAAGMLATLYGGAAAALPPDDVLKDKVVAVGQAMGLREAYQDRAEGLFVWRIASPGAAAASPSPPCDGFFVWYLKEVDDKVALDDSAALLNCHADPSQTAQIRQQFQSEVQQLQEEFKRQWLAAVGPIALTPPTAQTPGLVSAVLVLLSSAPAGYKRRESFPPAPDGFAWRRLSEINAAVLVPEGWSFKRTVGGGVVVAVAYFVSVENIDTNGRFQTGLSLNVLVARSRSADAEAYAKTLIAQVADQNAVQVLRPPSELTDGAFHQYDCLVRMPGTAGPLVVEHRAIVNTTTKTTYVLSFESPEPGWKDAWAKGAKMEELLLLDDNL